MKEKTPRIGVIMGSQSDWPVMEAAADILAEFGVSFEARVLSAHRHNTTRSVAGERRLVAAREDEDRAHVVVVVVLDAEQEQGRLRGDDDLHLFGELEPCAALPALLRHDHTRDVEELRALLVIECLEDREGDQVGRPGLGQGRGEQLAPPSAPEPAEHQRAASMSSMRLPNGSSR